MHSIYKENENRIIKKETFYYDESKIKSQVKSKKKFYLHISK